MGAEVSFLTSENAHLRRAVHLLNKVLIAQRARTHYRFRRVDHKIKNLERSVSEIANNNNNNNNNGIANDEQYKSWLDKRKILYWTANILILLYGIEANISNLTFIFYIQDRFNISQQDTGYYFSLAFVGNSLIQMLGSLLLGRYVDKTGNIKHTMMFIISISFTCHLVYSLHPNVWIVVVANSFVGISEALQSAVLGKIYFTDWMFKYFCAII